MCFAPAVMQVPDRVDNVGGVSHWQLPPVPMQSQVGMAPASLHMHVKLACSLSQAMHSGWLVSPHDPYAPALAGQAGQEPPRHVYTPPSGTHKNSESVAALFAPHPAIVSPRTTVASRMR
jgi:hypothetical protein